MTNYRDPECRWTLRELYNTARHPDRVFVGICRQVLEPEEDGFEAGPRPSQVRCVTYNASDARGACWGKSQAQKLWSGEKYLLNIDGHMRFAQHWDTSMIEVLAVCPSGKPVLSTFPAPYYPPRTLVVETPHVVARAFDVNTGLLLLSREARELKLPKRGAFIAGCYSFCRASFIEEVPYDPDLYFDGEEISISARAWTWG